MFHVVPKFGKGLFGPFRDETSADSIMEHWSVQTLIDPSSA